MRRFFAVAAVLALCLGLTQTTIRGDDNKRGDLKNVTDEQFVQLASASGLAEVNLGKLASQRSLSLEVKKFGREMVQDHEKANKELMELANKKGFATARTMDRTHQELWEKLGQASGLEFDRNYVMGQVKDHEEAVALFEEFAKNGRDADLKAFAARTLPTIKEHLHHAQNLMNRVKEVKGG